MNFWDFFWLMVWSFFIICYLMVLFQILLDVFRDDELSGLGKAGWVIALIILPWLAALIYLITRGKGMGQRQRSRHAPVPESSDVQVIQAYSPTEQISKAKALLDSGAITTEEYAALKARELA